MFHEALVSHIHPVDLEAFRSRQYRLGKDVHLLLNLHPELDKKLKQVETEVRDAFKELEDDNSGADT